MQAKITKPLIKALQTKEKPFEVVDEDLPGFLLRVQPSGRMNYYASFRLPSGQRNRVRIGDARVITPQIARDKAKEILASVVQGEDPAAAKRKGMTLETFLKGEYKDWALAHRKSGAHTVQRLLAAFSELLNLPLEKVNTWAVQKWSTERLKPSEEPGDKRGVTKATVNRDVAHLRAAISKAQEWGIVKTHPLKGLKLMKEDSAAIVRYLSDDETKSLLAALEAREKHLRASRARYNKWLADRKHELLPDLAKVAFADALRPMVLLTLKTGLRRGEIFQLKWADVDLDRATLTVRGDGAKSGKTRHIPITQQTVEVLRQWAGQSDCSGLVFPNRDGAERDNVRKVWAKLLEDAGIKEFRWHDMRHDFASKLVTAGVDLNTVRELLGHSDLKMTLRYAHLAPERKAAAIAVLDTPSNVVQLKKTKKHA